MCFGVWGTTLLRQRRVCTAEDLDAACPMPLRFCFSYGAKLMTTSDWYRPRQYVHLDWPMSRERAEELVTNSGNVVRHAFLPFITYSIAEPRYKPAKKLVEDKLRPIGFSSHADSHIFAYYGFQLKQLLEPAFLDRRVNSSVLAYRRFTGRKCNIHFANEVFNEVKDRESCAAIAIDVEQFFDSLDHTILKAAWTNLLGDERLPDDHYAVFKAITRFATIDRDEFYREFGVGRRARRKLRGPVCSPAEYRERVRGKGLIRTNKMKKGIPQGSPMSAILSNLYMLGTDEKICRFAESIGASYRRYSDDILLICDVHRADEFEQFVVDRLEQVKLAVNPDKTQRSIFGLNASTGLLTSDAPLQYLGFTFDGERKLVRSKTLARYMRRVKQGVASAARAARKAADAGGDKRIRRAEIYERYSHLGKRNFISYAYRAAEVMGDKSPRRQVRKHWQRLNEMLDDVSGTSEPPDDE